MCGQKLGVGWRAKLFEFELNVLKIELSFRPFIELPELTLEFDLPLRGLTNSSFPTCLMKSFKFDGLRLRSSSLFSIMLTSKLGMLFST